MSKPLKKENHSYINIIAVLSCVGVVVVILTVLFASYLFDKPTKDGPSSEAESSGQSMSDISDNSEPSESTASEEPVSKPEESSAPEESYTAITVADSAAASGNLVVVNEAHPFTGSVTTQKIMDIPDRKYKLYDSNIYFEKVNSAILNNMLNELFTFTESDALTITSAYSATDKTSENAAGLSFKCTVYPSSAGVLTEGKFLWLQENCTYYGFVLRYPEGKSSLTGHDAASNYFRYVGMPHSYLMTLNNLCLEEYIEFCRNFSFNHRYTFTYNGTEYSVYYCAASGTGSTNIKIPEGYEYTMSGDNMGGFIVTAYKTLPVTE